MDHNDKQRVAVVGMACIFPGARDVHAFWDNIRAGHDAMAMARITDIGMLFLRCHDGISHHPDEAVLLEDVEVGLDAFEAAVRATAASYAARELRSSPA